jgi:hypothetical protein
MAQVPMTDAVLGGVASSADNNAIIDNVLDLDARLGPVVSSSTAHARLLALEARTTDTGTSPGGIGNQQLANRLGSGVGTTTNVTTGTASAQLADLRTRMTAAEGSAARQEQFGTVNLNAAANGGAASANIVFAPPFAAAPHIDLSSSNARLTLAATNITNTGFTFGANNWTTATGGSVPVYWHASAKT